MTSGRILTEREGDTMKVLTGHHLSAEMILTIVVLAGLSLGAVVGLLLGLTMGNIGVGISLGVLGGLICGIVAGMLISDRSE